MREGGAVVELVVFSKDRALQVQGLLGSIQQNCDIFGNITVIYIGTTPDFKAGYRELSVNKRTRVSFVQEGNLRQILLAVLIRSQAKFLCFLTDDQVGYRDIAGVFDGSIGKLLDSLPEDRVCHSLRLGDNCRDFPQSIQEEQGVFVFPWDRQRGAFAYPFSVDGHIFRREYILGKIRAIPFDNPNKLEAQLQACKATAPKYMSCFSKSLFVGIPVNKVSTTSTCSCGEKYPYSPKYLNDLFLQGKIMDTEKMDFTRVVDIHQEIKLEFKEKVWPI